MTNKYFDVTLAVFISGYEKPATNRVLAENKKEAIYLAICDEVHNLVDEQVKEQIERCEKEGTAISILDEDIYYELGAVIELQEVDVEYNGKTYKTLLPAEPENLGMFASSRYFV